jgi:hypothetical protein
MPDNDDPNKGNDPTAAFQNRLKKLDGDAMAFATQLFDENFQLRGQKRELEKKLPADGSLILSKEDAATWEAFNALNMKPEEIAEKVKDTETLTGEIAALKKRDVLRDVAGLQGYKLSVLEDRDKATDGLEYIIKEEGKQGEKRKVAYVKHEGKEVPLEQFASEQWADFVPALKVEQGNGTAKRGMGGDPPPVGGAGNPAAEKAAAARARQDYRSF